MGVHPLLVEEVSDSEESVDDRVDRLLDESKFAIVLARLGSGSKQDGVTLPRGSVIDEISKIRANPGFPHLILLEDSLQLPTTLSTGLVYKSFSQSAFDAAILKVYKALRDQGMV